MQWLVNLEGLGLARTRPEDAPKRYAHWLDEVAGPIQGGPLRLAGAVRVHSEDAQPAPVSRHCRIRREGVEPTRGGQPRVRLRFDPRHRLVNPILYRREEAEACWARLEIPMLLVMGELSDHRARHTSYVTDEQLHALFRKLRLATVPGTGHMMHHEDPAAVASHIVAFERDCVLSDP